MRGLKANGVVVDIGGNIGDTALLLHLLNPSARIASIEPVPETYFYMLWNLEANRVPLLSISSFQNPALPGVLPINAGVSADGRNITFLIAPGWSKKAKDAALAKNWHHANKRGYSQNVTVATIRASRLMNVLKLPVTLRLAMLKIDCEGCEREAMTELADVIKHSNRLAGEIHGHIPHAIRGKQGMPIQKNITDTSTRGCGATWERCSREELFHKLCYGHAANTMFECGVPL